MEEYKKATSVYFNDEERKLVEKVRKDIYDKENKVVSISEVIRRAIHIAYKNGSEPPVDKEESQVVSEDGEQEVKREGSLWDNIDLNLDFSDN